MGDALLERLINSYCLVSKTGVAVYYPTRVPASIENLTLFMLNDPERLAPLNFSFCRQYRDPKDCWMYDEICKKQDRRIVLKCYNGDWKGPKLFPCYLGLWEMTYPLRAKGHLLGVVYGGQIVVKGVQDWRKTLKDIEKEVVWDPFDEKEGGKIPRKSRQEERIKAAIQDNDEIRNEDKGRLTKLLSDAVEDEGVKIGALLERYNEFKKFGMALDGVLDGLFTAKAEAATRRHIHDWSRDIADRGERLSEEPEQFWNSLDKAVETTMPNVRGYVLYRLDEYREAYKPERTCTYDRTMFSRDADFRKFCRHVFDELHKNGKKKKDYIVYDLLDENDTSQLIRNLFQQAVSDRQNVAKGTFVVSIPLAESDGKIAGGLVCVCGGSEQLGIGRREFSEYSLKTYIEVMEEVLVVLTMVFSRHAVVEAQANAWAIRSHELVAPINALKGYHDNIKYVFSKHVEPLISVGIPIKDMLDARISRFGKLCDLLLLIATSGSIKGGVRFAGADLAKNVLLPIVQPLRDYGKNEKGVSIFFSDNMFKIPRLFLYIDGMKRCVFNLIFNAIKYSHRKSKVTVDLQETIDNYEILIVNRGIGVPEGEEQRIFRMFTQGANADRVAAYGAGLGLYVARMMAKIHEGDVMLVSGDPKRTVFSLILPKSLHFQAPNPPNIEV